MKEAGRRKKKLISIIGAMHIQLSKWDVIDAFKMRYANKDIY